MALSPEFRNKGQAFGYNNVTPGVRKENTSHRYNNVTPPEFGRKKDTSLSYYHITPEFRKGNLYFSLTPAEVTLL